MPSGWPYSDLEYPGPDSVRSQQAWAFYAGMQHVTETNGRLHPALNGADWLGYHIACVEDYIAVSNSGTNEGRWFTLFTPNDYQNGTDLTLKAFDSGERRLLGGYNTSNGDALPDMVAMHNTVFMTDGKGRWLAGQAPCGFVRVEDNSAGTFDNEDSDSADNTADNVLLLPNTGNANLANDALYIGAAAEFAGFWIDQTTAITVGASGTNVTLALEYYNGSSWTNVTTDSDVDRPFTYGTASTSAWSSAQQHRVTWDRATQMSDWATTTVNGQSAYWVRLRVTAGVSGTSGYVAPKARKIMLIEDNAQKTPLLPACYEVGEDPATTAPSIKGWGLHRLDVNGTEQVSASLTTGGSLPVSTTAGLNIWYSWWDSTREIGTDPVNLGNYTHASNKTITLVIGSHPDPNIDKLRVFVQGTGTQTEADFEGDTAGIGIGFLRLVGEFTLATAGGSGTISDLSGGGTNNDRTTAWETIDRRFYGDGPYLASTIPNGIDKQPDVAAANGYYQSCCVHKGRVYCAGTDVAGYQHRVVWSIANNPHCFPKDNFTDVPMTDGDRIVAIRSAGSVVVVLGAQSVWAINGDPESSAVSVSKIADVGCLAKKAAITVGQRVFFLGAAGIYAVGAGGAVELLTPNLTRLFRDIWDTNAIVFQGSTLYQSAVHGAVAGYDPSREFVVFAIPGLLQQITDGRAPNRVLNDGMLQIDLVTGRMSILIGPPVSAMAKVPTGNSGFELWCGTPLGRLTRLTTDTLDANTTAAISGTATGGSSTTLADSSLALTASSSDTSFVGQMLFKTSSTGTLPEGRVIVSNTTDTFTVDSAWTTTATSGDLYYIGHYWMSIETGDITHDDPGAQHRFASVRLHLEAGMNASNALSVQTTDESRAESTTWTTGGALSASTKVEQLSLGGDTGFTQRLRVLARMGAARFRLFALAVKRTLGGRPRG